MSIFAKHDFSQLQSATVRKSIHISLKLEREKYLFVQLL